MSGVEKKKLSSGVSIKLYGPDGKLKQEYSDFKKPLIYRIMLGILFLVLIIPIGVLLSLRFVVRKLRGT